MATRSLLDATNSTLAVTKPHLLRSICDEVLQHESLDSYKMYHVVKIHHFKEKSLVGHEILILEISDNTNPIYRLLVERRPSRRKANGVVKTSKLNFLVTDSDDLIQRASNLPSSKFHHLTTFIPPLNGAVPTFVQLCEIFKRVQDNAPNYNLRKNQCYWFCATSVERIRKELGLKERPGLDFNLQGAPGLGRYLTGKLKITSKLTTTRDIEKEDSREKQVEAERETEARESIEAMLDITMKKAEKEHENLLEIIRREVEPLFLSPEARQDADACYWESQWQGITK